MATHSSVLAWRIPGMAEPDGLLSMGLHRVGHDWSNLAAAAAAWSTISTRQWATNHVFFIFMPAALGIKKENNVFIEFNKKNNSWFLLFSSFISVIYNMILINKNCHRENGCMYMYGWVALLSTWNHHNTVNRYTPIQNLKKKFLILNGKNSQRLKRSL